MLPQNYSSLPSIRPSFGGLGALQTPVVSSKEMHARKQTTRTSYLRVLESLLKDMPEMEWEQKQGEDEK